MVNMEQLKCFNELNLMTSHIDDYKDVHSIMIKEINPQIIPKISFVIPTMGRSKLLREALDSILRQKSIVKYEIVIVDNSADYADKMIYSYLEGIKTCRVRYYINQKNIGMTGNFNRCVALADSEWVAMLHDDDLLADWYLEDMVRYIHVATQYSNRVGMIMPQKVKFYDKKIPNVCKNEEVFLSRYTKKDTLITGIGPSNGPTCGFVVNKKAFYDVGGYNPLFYPSHDHVLGFQMQAFGYLTYKTSDVLGFYRIEMNASMKKETFLQMHEADSVFLDYLLTKKENVLYKVFFENAQYSLRIKECITTAKSYMINDLSIGELDFKNKYKIYPVHFKLIIFLRKVANRIRKKIKIE